MPVTITQGRSQLSCQTQKRNVPLSTTPLVVTGNADTASEILPQGCVDVIVTSPPYWQKRDYGHEAQLGWENTPDEFVRVLVDIVDGWRPLLKPRASIFINLGDSVRGGVTVGITTLFELEMSRRGWKLLSRIMWAKRSGLPNPHGRLAQRYEMVFHFSLSSQAFTDTFAYAQHFDLSEGNIWYIRHSPSKSPHLAPFPAELPRRAILLACAERVCKNCGDPLVRVTQRGLKLDPKRKQSARALEIWKASGLTDAHLRAIRATGIGDAGKSLKFQTGSGSNSAEVQRLAAEAKTALNGYFREFTFALPEHVRFEPCASCGQEAYRPGLVLDPFMGTGTTLFTAQELGRRSIGIDLNPLL